MCLCVGNCYFSWVLSISGYMDLFQKVVILVQQLTYFTYLICMGIITLREETWESDLYGSQFIDLQHTVVGTHSGCSSNFMIWEIMAWFADILVNYGSGRLSEK